MTDKRHSEQQPDSTLEGLAYAAPEALAGGPGGLIGYYAGNLTGVPGAPAAGAFIGNATGPLIEATWHAIRCAVTARLGRGSDMIVVASTELGMSPDELVASASSNASTLELLARVVDAAGQSPSKTRSARSDEPSPTG